MQDTVKSNQKDKSILTRNNNNLSEGLKYTELKGMEMIAKSWRGTEIKRIHDLKFLHNPENDFLKASLLVPI